jgi:hypothetical protein
VRMGFEFKPKLSVVLAVMNGVSVALAYVVSQGDITITIVALAISTGITAGVSYYKEKT